MQNTWIWVIGIVIVAGIGYFIWQSSVQAPATDAGAAQTDTSASSAQPGASDTSGVNVNVNTNVGTQAPISAAVTYTDSGFSPSSVTIAKGGTVTFTNESSGQMWVASNPHPTHTDYPGFDEKAAVGKGSSYSFTFGATGTWGYHNHRRASDAGVIIVQ